MSSSVWIGKAVKRREDARLLRGEGRYLADLRVPGTQAVAFLRSPYAHARIERISASVALALPGVSAVFDGRYFADRLPPLATAHWRVPDEIQRRARPMIRPDRQPLVAVDKARFVGEAVAVVVADNPYIAEDALDAVEVEYAPLDSITDVAAARRADAALIHDEWGDNIALSMTLEKGDVDRAFDEADIVVREQFRSHRYTGVPLETRGVLAAVDPFSGHLRVWSSTQVAHRLRDLIAAMLDLPADYVRVVAPDVGGGFGVKGHAYPEEIVVPFLARELQRPLRWVEDRAEHMRSAAHAREQIHQIEIAADAEGRIRGVRDRVTFDMGAYNPLGLVLPYNTAAHLFGPYVVPAAHLDVSVVVTNKTPHAPYRGAGRPEAVFALERVLDRLAAVSGIDPAEIRLRNLVPADRMPYDNGLLYRDGHPMLYDSGDYPSMFRRAVELIDPERWVGTTQNGEGNRLVGVGFASYIEGTGIGPFESGSVAIDGSGRIRVATGVCSQGQGHATTFAQIAAEVLNVPLESIEVVAGDTASIPHGFGTVASRGIVTGGTAVLEAAQTVRDKALRVGADMLEASVEDLELADGTVRVKGLPVRAVTLGAIASALLPGRARPNKESPGLAAESYFEPPTVTYASGIHAAAVAIDVETGQLDLLRYVVVHDCGRVVNPMVVDGQIVGGVAQGIGGALLEDLVYDADGQLTTTSLMDYLLPSSTDVPPVLLDHEEHLSPLNPLGLKGLGEGGAIGPPAAIANAVENALRPLGVAIRETPLSPDRLRALIRAARDRDSGTLRNQLG